jgi:hypothetical protein
MSEGAWRSERQRPSTTSRSRGGAPQLKFQAVDGVRNTPNLQPIPRGNSTVRKPFEQNDNRQAAYWLLTYCGVA